MNTTKKSCKYYAVCGSNENCKRCKGYVKMKVDKDNLVELIYIRNKPLFVIKSSING